MKLAKHYYFCGHCGDASVLSSKQDLVCQGMEGDTHWHPLTHLGKGKKGKRRQEELVKGFRERRIRQARKDAV